MRRYIGKRDLLGKQRSQFVFGKLTSNAVTIIIISNNNGSSSIIHSLKSFRSEGKLME